MVWSAEKYSDSPYGDSYEITSQNGKTCVIKGRSFTSSGKLYCKMKYGDTDYIAYYKVNAISMGNLTIEANPSGGTVNAGTKVYLTCNESGASIFYTTDGTNPIYNSNTFQPTNGLLYNSSGITINQTTTIKAFAAKRGYESSSYGTWTFTVIQLVTSITLNKTTLSLQTGQSETLTATVKPDNATDKTVSWTSSNTSVATVTSSGKVTAISKGSATITCTANDGSGVKATCLVTVTDPIIKVTSITLNKTSLSLETGQNETLTATVKPDNATDKTVTWSSTPTGIVTVDNGKVTAISKGSATITCTAKDGSGVNATCEVTVKDPEPDGYTDISQYSNIVYLEPASTSPESTITLPVRMKNAQTNISGFQFDLVLPPGVSVAKDEDNFYLIELSTDRTTTRKHTVSAQLQADGTIRVVCYSNNNSTFSGTDGNVLSMTLQVAADAPTGDQSIKLRDVVMTTPSLDSHNVPWVVSKLTIEDYIPGDVNGDKLVNVVDVAGVVNLILNNGDTSKLNRKAADVNSDGNINVVDVAGVVNIILGGGANGTRTQTRAGVDASLLFFLTPSSIPQGETSTMHIKLQSNEDKFTGCQFDLYLPEGLSVEEEDGFPLVEIGSGTTTRRHVVSTSAQPDGALRVVCYSNNNYVFNDTEIGSEILTATIRVAGDAPLGKCTIALRNITLSRPDATGVSIDDWDATYCAVVPSGIDDITADQGSDSKVFSLSGQRLTAPCKGVNIVGGRKVVVK